jgi:phage tail-like protein
MASPASLISRASRFSDYLMNYHFHVMDVSFTSPAVLNISAGFRHCSAPQISVETKDIKEGTFEYHKRVVVSASVDDVELQQGMQVFNSDFYDWIVGTIAGKQNMRKNLLLIQFSDVLTGVNTGTGTASQILNTFVPINDLFARTPARAWLLRDCLPVRYKAGTDFDALSVDVSIAELTVRPYQIDEFSFGL